MLGLGWTTPRWRISAGMPAGECIMTGNQSSTQARGNLSAATATPLGRRMLLAPFIGALCMGCSMEQGESADTNSASATHSAELAPVHSEKLADGTVLSFWSAGPGGPSAIELVGHEGLRLDDRMAEVSGATPIQVYEAWHEGPVDPTVLELLEPMSHEWNPDADRERIAVLKGVDASELKLEPATASVLVDKTHGTSWFTTNHCNQTVGTALVECLHANGPTVQTQNHGFGNFGIGFKVDPWVFTAYNDHTGTATFTMNWSGGVFITTSLAANFWAARQVNTNGNEVWGRMTNVGQVGHMAARSTFLILH